MSEKEEGLHTEEGSVKEEELKETKEGGSSMVSKSIKYNFFPGKSLSSGEGASAEMFHQKEHLIIIEEGYTFTFGRGSSTEKVENSTGKAMGAKRGRWLKVLGDSHQGRDYYYSTERRSDGSYAKKHPCRASKREWRLPKD